MLREAVLLLLAFSAERRRHGAQVPKSHRAIARENPAKMLDPFKDALINAICAF